IDDVASNSLSGDAVDTWVMDTQSVLEDFSSGARLNGEGDPLIFAYLGEDPSQTYSITDGQLQLNVGKQPDGAYLTFLSRQSGGYQYPQGYAQNYIESGTWNPDFNRLTFWVKPNITVPRSPTGSEMLEIGTYIRDHSDPDSEDQGAHFYHQLD